MKKFFIHDIRYLYMYSFMLKVKLQIHIFTMHGENVTTTSNFFSHDYIKFYEY